MLNIACVKVGTKYSAEYVNILFDMVRRNLPDGYPGKFVCFTEDPTGLSEGISTAPVPPGLNGWWNKLALFRPEAFPAGERVLFFDLDTLIVGKLDEIVEYSGDFAITRDFFRGYGYGSAIMAWEAGKMCHIWEEWIADGKPELADGDQEWIEHVVSQADILQDLYPGSFCSFKFHCDPYPPRHTKVVCFHGEPRPHEATTQWVKDVWKIGGGQGFDLEFVCNTTDEQIISNIRAACKRDVPWVARLPQHIGHAVIVGGAPSLKNHIEEIKWRKSTGQKIFALNNAYKFLRANDIEPDYQVILDGRAENAEFLPEVSKSTHYIASQCHPDTWDKAEGKNTVLFHSYIELVDQAIENPDKKPECLIGGGNTVGLTTMALVYTLGYRRLHLYGMDSSYSDGEHHAYEQSLNDHDRPLDVHCNGRDFKAAAWMIGQANQFQDLAVTLCNLTADDEFVITVAGDGLLPWVAKQLEIVTPPVDDIIEKNGIYWPVSDKAAEPYIIPCVEHVRHIVEQCPDRRAVVQAGGNVGLWPRELAKYFSKVITFEPDFLNYRCLLQNCQVENVVPFNKALGKELDTKALKRNYSNCGANYIEDGNSIVVSTIDDLDLDDCDLIQLDIEGYEFFALQGGEQTIDRFQPVICIEMNGLNARYDISDEEIISWLRDHGYREALKIGRDVVFAPIRKETWTNNYSIAL